MLGLWFALAVARPAPQAPARHRTPKPARVRPAVLCGRVRGELEARVSDVRIEAQAVRLSFSQGSAHGVARGDAVWLRIDHRHVYCFNIESVVDSISTATVTIPKDMIDMIDGHTEVRIHPTNVRPPVLPPGAVG